MSLPGRVGPQDRAPSSRSTAPAAYWQASFAEHRAVLDRCDAELGTVFEEVAEKVAAAIAEGQLLMLCGNGGSAADAQHIAAEFTVRFVKDRRALRAMALATDCSALTATGNDLGFEQVFSRQVEALGRPGDILIGISTSGNSANVLAAFDVARNAGLTTIAFTGMGGGAAASRVDHLIAVPSTTTARIQEMHILLGHLLCGVVERQLGSPT
jgi:D-sedoheptulose 7-phosphate isomerase